MLNIVKQENEYTFSFGSNMQLGNDEKIMQIENTINIKGNREI